MSPHLVKQTPVSRSPFRTDTCHFGDRGLKSREVENLIYSFTTSLCSPSFLVYKNVNKDIVTPLKLSNSFILTIVETYTILWYVKYFINSLS